MLEPRRIAAVAAADWMAKTLGESIGQTIGYSIRFDSRLSERTRIEVVTEGILTRRLLKDPGLEDVSLIIFDEYHERSLQADLALALCLDIRRGLRDDLKLLVMSATLDSQPVAALLDHAPVVSSGGEAFPVAVRYSGDRRDKPLEERITDAVRTALRETSGDILVFLPGAGEIRRTAAAIGSALGSGNAGLSLHPLYGDLPLEEQQRAILPSRKRKIVLATNIAETSLTIEGVSIVIDSGLTRRLQYDAATGMNRLMTVAVSRASAEQRKGRAGRLGPGACYRLYSRHAFESMMPFAPPDMLVSDLSSLALELAAWGVNDPLTLSWLNPPPLPAWTAARRLLSDLSALDAKGSITPVGREMAALPLHPRLGRLLLRAAEIGQYGLGADLAAILSERDIFRRGTSGAPDRPGRADISERLEVLQQWRKDKGSAADAEPWALRSVDRVSRQLQRLAAPGRKGSKKDAGDPIPALLLHAYPDRVARRRDERSDRYLLSQGRGVRLWPSSPLAGSLFIVAAQLDAGEKDEGLVYLAEAITEERLRQEMGGHIERIRRVDWDRREERIVSVLEERLGAILLSAKALNPTDDEVVPLICEAIRRADASIRFSEEARQLQGRVGLMGRLFPEEGWPDLTAESLLAAPETWLSPFLTGIRTLGQLTGLDMLPALLARLSWKQRQCLDERAPVSMVVPSGHKVVLDYTAGELPVLAVKLQEMFGLADTPSVAAGRVRVLLHLLSPARRPVQITQDLRGFWNSGYPQVRKELKGRYPRHPWPDDPWNAVPTRRSLPRNR